MHALPSLRPGLIFGLLCGFVLGIASSASAQSSERIDFDFASESSISLLGGTIVTPPDGTIDFGSGRIWVEATAPGAYVSGGQFLFGGFAMGGTVAKNVMGAADIAGYYQTNQAGTLAGTLAPAQDGGQFAGNLALNMNVQVDCAGSGCGLLGFPISDVGLSLLPISFLPVDALASPGLARIQMSVPIEIDGVLGTLDLVGVEVARAFIPEPGTFVLVAAGLGVLAGRRRVARAAH
jgi:hypothetical protein